MDLHRFVGHAHRALGGEQLGHRRLFVHAVALIFQPRRPQRQQPRGVDFGRHVGQFVLNRLKFRNKSAELFALLGIFERRFIRALRDAYRQRRNRDAPAVQNPQAVDESFAALAAELRRRQPAIGEQNFARGRTAHPQLVFFLPDAKSGVPFSRMNAEIPCDDAARSVTAIATQTSATCALVVNVLPPFRTQVIAVEHRRGARAARVRSRFGLGQRPAADPFAATRASECSAASARRDSRPGKYDWCTAKRAPRRSARSMDRRAPVLPSGCCNRRSCTRRRPASSGKTAPSTPSSPSVAKHVHREMLRFVPLHHVRPDLASAKSRIGFAELVLFRRVSEIHWC